MNSEFSSIPESDNNEANEPTENITKSTENPAEPLPDIWLDEPETSIETEYQSEADLVAANEDTAAEAREEQPSEVTEIESSEQFTLAIDEAEAEPELFTDRWLDESESEPVGAQSSESTNVELQQLEAQRRALLAEIDDLTARKEQIALQQIKEVQKTIGELVEEGMKELKERKNSLQIEIDKLERRQERIRQEMRTNFAGASQDLAIRVQGFKNYLVGSLQDLAIAAEQLELNTPSRKGRMGGRETDERLELDAAVGKRSSREGSRAKANRQRKPSSQSPQPQFVEQAFAEQSRQIRQLLDRYRSRPDYYGPPWQLRRTFEAVHAEKVQEWFFARGGRGAINGMNSRLQNILIASAIISIVRHLYGDRCQTLVLIDTPEKLGEWRRGLQDCLGIARSDFGASRGVVLFDSAEVVVQRADRLIKDKLLPLIIIDETEELINLSLLKFPLWLAFAPEAKAANSNYLY
ncbi:DUF3086 domain-containing protein [Myxosarcina sp. GI1]|uniref:DUF3086 domain-containing protein n=1 Tax=Myxosarcina sp. GI1 TaxID=1541065 RepID=UPI0005619669|nr:DUF3086 domain-containing protein [Myxosarcina sp. GI1]